MRTTIIYGLIDPRNGALRYIGKTNNLKARYSGHLTNLTSNTHKINWIRQLLSFGLKPDIIVIDEVLIDEWKYWELFYVAYYRFIGCNLTNTTIGGDGLTFGNQTSFKKGQNEIPIYQIDLTGLIINTFRSRSEAIKKLGYKISFLDCDNKTTHGFLFFKVTTWDSYTEEQQNTVLLNIAQRYTKLTNGLQTRFVKGHKPLFTPAKSVIQIDKNTGTIIQIFESAAKAELVTGATGISKVITGKIKTSGGYKWKLNN